MAEQKNAERVALYIPRGAANEEPNFIIGINGKKYILPRGKTSMVPPEVKAEYDRSLEAQEALDAKIDAMLANSQQ